MKIEDLLPKDSLEMFVMKMVKDYEDKGVLGYRGDEKNLIGMGHYSIIVLAIEQCLREIPEFKKLIMGVTTYNNGDISLNWDFRFYAEDEKRIKKLVKYFQGVIKKFEEMLLGDTGEEINNVKLTKL